MKVLDHGEVNLVESWGSDENIIRAARQSTDGAFRGWGERYWKCHLCGFEASLMHFTDEYRNCPKCPAAILSIVEEKGDERLLRFLYRNRHMTPFEMCGAIFEVKAPIFVFREWHRHRTQSYNEMSARYIPIPNEHYIPSLERLQQVDVKNKQAGAIKGGGVPYPHVAIAQITEAYDRAQEFYQELLDGGVPKELARVVLPVGRYSKMWASANLRNWMAFLELRNAPEAQWEIQQYAKAVQSLLKERFPRTIALFEEGR